MEVSQGESRGSEHLGGTKEPLHAFRLGLGAFAKELPFLRQEPSSSTAFLHDHEMTRAVICGAQKQDPLRHPLARPLARSLQPQQRTPSDFPRSRSISIGKPPEEAIPAKFYTTRCSHQTSIFVTEISLAQGRQCLRFDSSALERSTVMLLRCCEPPCERHARLQPAVLRGCKASSDDVAIPKSAYVFLATRLTQSVF